MLRLICQAVASPVSVQVRVAPVVVVSLITKLEGAEQSSSVVVKKKLLLQSLVPSSPQLDIT